MLRKTSSFYSLILTLSLLLLFLSSSPENLQLSARTTKSEILKRYKQDKEAVLRSPEEMKAMMKTVVDDIKKRNLKFTVELNEMMKYQISQIAGTKPPAEDELKKKEEERRKKEELERQQREKKRQEELRRQEEQRKKREEEIEREQNQKGRCGHRQHGPQPRQDRQGARDRPQARTRRGRRREPRQEDGPQVAAVPRGEDPRRPGVDPPLEPDAVRSPGEEGRAHLESPRGRQGRQSRQGHQTPV